MKLYIKPWCPWCIEAVTWLEKRNFTFEKIDVLQDRAAFDHMRSISGQGLTPTLEIDGKVLPDFDVKQLERFLETNNITAE
ncbi:MAG: glutaredoxin domain-containing protein [Chthoniobacterales bacterium]